MPSKDYCLDSEIPYIKRLASSFVYVLQCAFPDSEFLEGLRIKIIQSIIKSLSRKLKKHNRTSGWVLQVERRKNLTESEFINEYMNRSKPVIFEGAALSWACTKKWNLDYFKEQFGNKKLQLHETHGLVERELERTGGKPGSVFVEELKGKDFIDGIRQGSGKYMRFGSLMESERQLIGDLDAGWLQSMRRTFFGGTFLSFIGPAGRRTPMHAGISAFFFVMAEGEKHWTLYSPASSSILRPMQTDYNFSDADTKKMNVDTHPGLNLLSRYETVMKKGDVLFVPTWWWHEVENLSESWGTRCGFGNLRTFLRYPSFVFVRVFLGTPSIFKILQHQMFGKTSAQPSLVHPRFFVDD